MERRSSYEAQGRGRFGALGMVCWSLQGLKTVGKVENDNAITIQEPQKNVFWRPLVN